VSERPDAQDRLADATGAVGGSRDRLTVLIEQQAALRRVATLVARGVSPSETFAVVVEEMARCLHVDIAAVYRYEADGSGVVVGMYSGLDAMPTVGEHVSLEGDNIGALVLSTGRTARMDSHENAAGPIAERVHKAGVRSAVGVPIVVDDQVWGTAIVATRHREPLPPDTEARLGDFAELITTAIANAGAHAVLRQLSEQQAALRRVATLVARGASPSEVFSAVAEEIAHCLDVPNVEVFRYEDNGAVIVGVGSYAASGVPLPSVGERIPTEGDNISARVFRTGQAVRMDSYAVAVGPLAERVRAMGMRSVAGAPIVVDERVWGTAIVGSNEAYPLPPDTEERLADFADLGATAIANADTRDQLRAVVEQQAALRRVATLVAQGVASSQVFGAVAEEMCRCLRFDNATVNQYDGDEMLVLAIANNSPVFADTVQAGERLPIDGDYAGGRVFRTGRAAYIDSYENIGGAVAARLRDSGIRFGVGVPIVVGGRLWGMLGGVAGSHELPGDIEGRLSDFADLVVTAIANAATREELQASRDRSQALAEQQAALRRVATLVARGASPSEVLSAVAEEMVNCLHVENAGVVRYEADRSITIVSACVVPQLEKASLLGSRWSFEGANVSSEVLRTGRAARWNSTDNATGAQVAHSRKLGFRCAVGVPIFVDGRVWGLAVGSSTKPEPLPDDTEQRIGDFTDLAATAIANAATRDELITTRDELIASRARIVAATDQARRRLERDLHDGAQQRLVTLGLRTRMAEAAVPAELDVLRSQLSDLASGLSVVSTELQEISRGIHPAILSDGGLGPALRTLARRCPIPPNIDVLVEGRLPESVEVAAYYVVAEALTNAAKYSQATNVKVCAEVKEATLCLSIQDDGIGGADSRKGSGLIGLKDRVEVLGGHLKVISPMGSGTSLCVTIPLDD
jgi:GAF domain-containing protein